MNKNSEKSVANKNEKKIIQFILGYFLVLITNASIKSLFALNAGLADGLSFLAAVVLIILFLRCARYLVVLKFGQFFFLEGAFILLYLFSELGGEVSQDVSLFEQALFTLGLCIPVSIAFSTVVDKGLLLKSFLKISYILVALGSVVLLTASTIGLANRGTYNMSVAGMMLPGLLLLVVLSVRKSSPINILFILLGVISLLAGGSRWPLISVFVCICFCLVIFDSRNKALAIVGIVLLIGVMAMFWTDIIQQLQSFLQQLGINSRTVMFLENGTFLSSTSQRTDFLFPYYMDLIMEKPIFGWGLFGGWIQEGLGPHNMLLELLLAFGVPVGLLLSFCAVVLPLFAMKITKNRRLTIWLIVFYSMVVPMFLVEGDFATSTSVFCLYIITVRSFVIQFSGRGFLHSSDCREINERSV